MKVVYTSQAWLSIDSCIEFLFSQGLREEKIAEIIDQVFDRAESLRDFPLSGQVEPILSSRLREYRRLTISYYKIIYFVEQEIVFITDIFDSRQDPKKMRG